MAHIRNDIRKAIAGSGMSFRAVARASGVDVAAISRLMAGTRTLKIESAEKVADALGLRLRLVRKRPLVVRQGDGRVRGARI